jgi:hypothetical protein
MKMLECLQNSVLSFVLGIATIMQVVASDIHAPVPVPQISSVVYRRERSRRLLSHSNPVPPEF